MANAHYCGERDGLLCFSKSQVTANIGPMRPILSIQNLYKNFDSKSLAAINDVSFDLVRGEVVALMGPSGSGKSTLVKLIAGIIAADRGEVNFDGQKSEISFVPQEYQFEEEKNIFANIASALEGHGHFDQNEIHHRVRQMVEVFGLQYKDGLLPHQLSTGQRQRAVLARALVTSPRLLLLDEPFAHLDLRLRNEIKDELFSILDRSGTTCLMATHEREDAFVGPKRIILLADGILQQVGRAEDLYWRSHNAYTARFFGPINLIASPIVQRSSETIIIKNSIDHFSLDADQIPFDLGTAKFCYMAIRPEAVQVCEHGQYGGEVREVHFHGGHYLIALTGVDQNCFWANVSYSDFQRFKNYRRLRFNLDLTLVSAIAI